MRGRGLNNDTVTQDFEKIMKSWSAVLQDVDGIERCYNNSFDREIGAINPQPHSPQIQAVVVGEWDSIPYQVH